MARQPEAVERLMILRSNVDYMWSAVVNPRLGQAPYAWGGSFDRANAFQGTDCSGAVSAALEALLYGPQMSYVRQFWTGTFAGAAVGSTGPYEGVACTAPLVCIAKPTDAPVDAAMIIAVRQNPDPTQAHMICRVGGVDIEMGGESNDYHTSQTDSNCSSVMDTTAFNQWLFLPGTISNPQRGLDYAGGRIPGKDIVAQGFSFVCRYVTDGGPSLPDKLLTKAEADDLQAAGIGIVSNFESTGVDAKNGFTAGAADAQIANANHLAAGGPPDRPIYFSLDWDEDPGDDAGVFAYFKGVAFVIGLKRTAAYGGYWPLKRLLDAGLITYAWQTEAWSGDPNNLGPDGPDGTYFDPRFQLLQRNEIGYATVSGVQCDQNESYAADFGQWNYTPGETFVWTDQQMNDLYTWIGDLHGASFNPTTSQSPFRAPGEGSIWTTKDFPRNDDGFIHPMYTEWAAKKGDPVSIRILQNVANMDVTQAPDRAEDIALAKNILAEIGNPVPGPAPVGPKPSPIVNKRPVPSGFHTIMTVISGGLAAGTWMVQHFGGALSPDWAAAISSALVGAGTLVNFLTKEVS